MKNFNLLYHGNAEDVSALLETGVEMTPAELGALLCNVMRKIALLEAKAATPVPVRRAYKVIVQKVVAFGRVHDLDRDAEGDYTFTAINEEDALDQFHLTVPIKVLEDFEISAVVIP
ncbi:MAG: hypothetical protein KAQ88_05885 [Hyphomicrobiaceae bacterium]|nr:hypothetical protein [Hyphomicrobiaceae bacterium]